jgi:hypothetical protein
MAPRPTHHDDRGHNRRGHGWIIALLAVAGIGMPVLMAVVVGTPAVESLLVGAVCVGMVALWDRPPQAAATTFPAAPQLPRNRGTRRDAFQLSWSVTDGKHRVGAQVVNRLQRIAAQRLAASGLELGNPADRDRIVARIGGRAYQILATPPGLDTSGRDFLIALAAVENLGPVPADAAMTNRSGKDRR